MTQIDMIKEYLRKNQTLTSLEAINMFGCTRLAAVIHKLKSRGWKIVTINETGKNRYGKSVTYAVYVCLGEPTNG